MPRMQKARRSLIVVASASLLGGALVVLGGMGGATHVWKGGLLLGIAFSAIVNGVTGIAICVWLVGYCRDVRSRGESTWLPWVLAMFIGFNGLALLSGSGTPFAPRPVAIALLLFSIFVRVTIAGFVIWHFPRLRRELKAEGKRPTRFELQSVIDELRNTSTTLDTLAAPAHPNSDLIQQAQARIEAVVSWIENVDRNVERMASYEQRGISNGGLS